MIKGLDPNGMEFKLLLFGLIFNTKKQKIQSNAVGFESNLNLLTIRKERFRSTVSFRRVSVNWAPRNAAQGHVSVLRTVMVNLPRFNQVDDKGIPLWKVDSTCKRGPN